MSLFFEMLNLGETFKKYFEIVDIQGVLGMSKLGIPFQMIPGLDGLGRVIGHLGLQFDNKYARKLGLPLFFCWMVALRLRKTEKK